MSLWNGWNNKLIAVVTAVVLSLTGWFVYSLWYQTAQQASEWRSADEEMLRLLAQQSETKPAKQAGAAAASQPAPQPAPADKDKASSSAGAEPPPPSASGAGAAVPPAASPAPGNAAADGKINLNQATREQLTKLPGIGESKANAILMYREQLGGRFQTVEQLLNVKGIGDKVLAKIKPYLVLEP